MFTFRNTDSLREEFFFEQTLNHRLKQELDLLRDQYGFPGATCAYILPDGTIGEVAVGWHDVEAKVPMTPHSRMLAASIGKSFVAAVGPFKIEVVFGTSVDNDDTYTSKLVRPLAAFMVPASDAGATTQNQSVTISGKVLTFRDPATTAQTVVVIGF